MIVNMPVNGATGGVHPHPPVTTTTNNNNNNNDTNTTNNNNLQQTQCEFNFLKRKYETDQQQQLDQQQHQQHQHQQTPDYEEQLVANPWKKRHLDYDGDMCFQLQLETNNATATGTGTGTETTTTTTSVAAVTTSISSSSSSSFINDLFAYDSSLLVPAASYCAPPSAPMEAGDAGGWQTGELLELDHRYNSGLQTEIAQLNATLPPPQTQQQQQQQQPQQHHQDLSGNSFLVPQKQSLSMPQARQVACGRRSSPAASESEPDFEDKNLSWLLNFKFDEFPHLSPDVGGAGVGQRLGGAAGLEAATPTAAANMASASPCSSASPASASNSNHSLNSSSQSCHTTLLLEQRGSPKSCSSASTIGALTAITNGTGTGTGAGTGSVVTALSTTSTTKTGRKFEELVMEVTSEMDGNDMIVAEHVIVEDTTSKAPKKPPFTYTELIEYALEDKGELTVSGIYQWISDRFPYYKSNDDRWKNSVRHNLSINPHFRKGVKAPQGAGHLWAISSGDSAENVLAWEHKKQRLDLFFKMESINRERLQQHQQQMQQQQQQLQQQQQQQQQQQCSNSPEQQQQQPQPNATNCIYDEAAVAAAALTQEMLQHTTPSETSPSHHHHHQQQHHQPHHQHNHHHQQQQQSQPQQQQRLLPFSDLLSDEELRKTAGQILNGIHREVEVQSVNSIISTYQDVLLDNEDYLNPIHKDVVVTESGLRQHQHQHHNQQQQQHQQQHQQQQQQQQHSSGSSNGCSSNSILANSLTHSQYYITEIDPMELGIQMSHHQVEPSEEEVLFSDDFNLNYFGYNPGSDIVA